MKYSKTKFMIFLTISIQKKAVSNLLRNSKFQVLICATGIFLFVSNVLATADTRAMGQVNKHLRIDGELMGSYELWDFFRPQPAINNNNSYDLWVLRARLGALLTTSIVDAYAQAQYIGLYDLPNDSVAVPGGPLGLGAGYFHANHQSTNVHDIFLKQGFLNFKLDAAGLHGASIKLGRFAFADGLEYKSGVAKFDAIKHRRIGQRLIGGFNAIYVGRSFDGFSAVYDQPAFNWTISGLRPTQGALSVEGQKQIDDINLIYTAFTVKKDTFIPGVEGRLFYINYDDDRDTQVVDNRSLDARPRLSEEKIDLHTVGGHLLSLQQLGSGSIDSLLWGAYQFGRWTNQDHQAWAISAEVGYQWTHLPYKPWLRAIYYQSSGDGNAGDNKHKTFFSLVPSGRIFAKFPFFDQMNIRDAFLEMIVTPTEKSQVNINLHHLTLTNANDLLYRGLGASTKSGAFGYAGQLSGGSNDVGQLVDISFLYTFNKQISMRLYYGRAFGGSVIKNNFKGKNNANSFWADFSLSF
ncbi:Alginate export [Nitrosomonas aestuarii]|uniref:Alginate export n=1 Tax=Nitrosomonas aestuarii TaxID=52441 RepID=A0A1I3ZV64_9PROT|nr:Alginate export [Nitrosomonas aestuarii]